jgi:enoyl reductase
MAKDYGGNEYHRGDKGAWYQLITPDIARADSCETLDPWTWIAPDQPSAGGVPRIDPKTLAGLAFDQTVLPEPDIALSPIAQNQLVNLDTQITFGKALPRVWVTARLDDAAFGTHVAATTTAVPEQLTIDAGTPDADPESCTYDLEASGETYTADTKNAGCDVTYRKASPSNGYSLRATVVWKVTWTPSDDPDGPPSTPELPNGQSGKAFTVTVREDQAINR